MTEAQAVVACLTEHKEEIRRLGVRRLGLFGSVVRADFRPNSDIDVLVEFSEEAMNADYFDRYFDLLSLLQRVLRKKVDLVTAAGLKTKMRPLVERDLLYVLS